MDMVIDASNGFGDALQAAHGPVEIFAEPLPPGGGDGRFSVLGGKDDVVMEAEESRAHGGLWDVGRWRCECFGSATPPGSYRLLWPFFRWFRFAQPPANVCDPSGVKPANSWRKFNKPTPKATLHPTWLFIPRLPTRWPPW